MHTFPLSTDDCRLDILSSTTINAAISKHSSGGIVVLEKYNYSLSGLKIHFRRLAEGAPGKQLPMRLALLHDSHTQLIVSVKIMFPMKSVCKCTQLESKPFRVMWKKAP